MLACVLSEILQLLHEQAPHHVLLKIVDLLALELINHLFNLPIGNQSHQWVVILHQLKLVIHVIV